MDIGQYAIHRYGHAKTETVILGVSTMSHRMQSRDWSSDLGRIRLTQKNKKTTLYGRGQDRYSVDLSRLKEVI